ncbi:lipopolysaccharide assembly protein LapB, partial [Ideonella sp. 4Y11]|nr:lipopolysaccharide assembly protein LapB [Ideonella aquatica]
DQAAAALATARAAAPNAPRPLLLAGQRALRLGDAAGALALWGDLEVRDPQVFQLVAQDYADAARNAGQQDSARQRLSEAYQRAPSLPLLRALARLDGAELADAPGLLPHLTAQPTLSAALGVLSRPVEQWDAASAQAVREAVARAAKPLQRYRCAACGFEAQRHFWQCPGCLSWDSFPPRMLEEP